MMSDGSYVRECVFTRDKGVCADCGFDTERFRLDMNYLSKIGNYGLLAFSRLRIKALKRYPGIRIDRLDQLISQAEADKRLAAPHRFPINGLSVVQAHEIEAWTIHRRIKKMARARFARLTAEMLVRGFKTLTHNLWQADHIVPVELGGGLCGLNGYQTLCTGCHLRKNRTQAAARALRKKLT